MCEEHEQAAKAEEIRCFDEVRQLLADERIADLEAKLEELRNDLEALCLAFQYELRELKEKRLTSSKTVLAHAQRSTAEEADAAGEEAGS